MFSLNKRFMGMALATSCFLGIPYGASCFTAGHVFAAEMEQKMHSISPSDSAGFVMLAEAVPDVILEVRYYSTYNFVGDRIAGYEEPCVLLTREAAEALGAADDM